MTRFFAFLISLFLYSCAICSQSLAGTANPVDKFGKSPTLWELNAEALLLKPILGDERDVRALGVKVANADGGFRWGFGLGGAYHRYNAEVIRIQWQHLDVKKDLPGSYVGATNYGNAPFTVELENKYDELVANYGWHKLLNPKATLLYYVGAQYARVYNSKIKHFPAFPASRAQDVTGITDNDIADFSAVGPQIGAGLDYAIQRQLKALVDISIGLLGATQRNFTEFVNAPHYQVIDPAYKTRRGAIFSTGVKLGLDYHKKLKAGIANFAIGLQQDNYFNALYLINDGAYNKADYALQGAFFRFTWLGWV